MCKRDSQRPTQAVGGQLPRRKVLPAEYATGESSMRGNPAGVQGAPEYARAAITPTTTVPRVGPDSPVVAGDAGLMLGNGNAQQPYLSSRTRMEEQGWQ